MVKERSNIYINKQTYRVVTQGVDESLRLVQKQCTGVRVSHCLYRHSFYDVMHYSFRGFFLLSFQFFNPRLKHV